MKNIKNWVGPYLYNIYSQLYYDKPNTLNWLHENMDSVTYTIALFTVNSAHLHYNDIEHVCEAISGYFVLLARNCLASTLDYIVMQLRKTNCEQGH